MWGKEHLISFLTALAIVASAGAASGQAVNDVFEVEPTPGTVVMSKDDLGGNDDLPFLVRAATITATNPAYGDLTPWGDGFRYTAFRQFWEHGTDSFTYTLSDGTKSVTGIVFLASARFGVFRELEDFETPGEVYLESSSPFAGTVAPEAALRGVYGLRVTTPSGGPSGSHDGLMLSGLYTGEPDSHGQDIVCVRDVDTVESLDGEVLLLAIGELRGAYGVELVLTSSPSLAVSLRMHGADPMNPFGVVVHEQGPFDLSSAASELVVDWWRSGFEPGSHPAGGARLRIDDLVVAEIDDVDNAEADMRMHHLFPIVDGVDAFASILDVDDFEVWAGTIEQSSPAMQPIDLEGFEAGFGTWQSSGFSVQTTGPSALTGAWGLGLTVDHVTDQSVATLAPDNEDRIGVRFLVDTGSLVLADGDTFDLATLSSEDTTLSAGWLSAIQVDNSQGKNRIRAAQVVDGDQFIFTPWVVFSPGLHQIELRWRANTESWHSNGALELWLDGKSIGFLTLFANDDQRVEAVRLGAIGADPTTVGTLAFDNVEIWRPISMDSVPADSPNFEP